MSFTTTEKLIVSILVLIIIVLIYSIFLAEPATKIDESEGEGEDENDVTKLICTPGQFSSNGECVEACTADELSLFDVCYPNAVGMVAYKPMDVSEIYIQANSGQYDILNAWIININYDPRVIEITNLTVYRLWNNVSYTFYQPQSETIAVIPTVLVNTLPREENCPSEPCRNTSELATIKIRCDHGLGMAFNADRSDIFILNFSYTVKKEGTGIVSIVNEKFNVYEPNIPPYALEEPEIGYLVPIIKEGAYDFPLFSL